MQLVKSEPGPMVMMSACWMASSAWGSGRASGGTRLRRLMPLRLAVILVTGLLVLFGFYLVQLPR